MIFVVTICFSLALLFLIGIVILKQFKQKYFEIITLREDEEYSYLINIDDKEQNEYERENKSFYQKLVQLNKEGKSKFNIRSV